MPLISSPPGIGPASTRTVRSPARAAAIAAAMPEAPAPRITTSLSTMRDSVANSCFFPMCPAPVGREGPWPGLFFAASAAPPQAAFEFPYIEQYDILPPAGGGRLRRHAEPAPGRAAAAHALDPHRDRLAPERPRR